MKQIDDKKVYMKPVAEMHRIDVPRMICTSPPLYNGEIGAPAARPFDDAYSPHNSGWDEYEK